MVKYNSIETPNIYPNLNDHSFNLNKISKFRNNFIGEIRERELMSKRVSI